jgi:hypothetical protein
MKTVIGKVYQLIGERTADKAANLPVFSDIDGNGDRPVAASTREFIRKDLRHMMPVADRGLPIELKSHLLILIGITA